MDYISLIKSFKKEDFKNDVNLHIHSSFSDGTETPESLIIQAKQKGLKYISICDHNTLNAYLKTDILKEEMIIPAIEFDCWFGYVFMHILGYGIDVNNPKLQALCAKTKRETEADWIRIFSKRKPKDIVDAIHEAGGIAVLAHPACCWAFNIENLVKEIVKIGLDGLETHYTYHRHRSIIKFHGIKVIEKIADKYNLIKTGGTDEHSKLL